MATRIRLQRKGRKKLPYYYVVVADARSPRDGKFIERIGSYNPNTNPATIDIDGEQALTWLLKGAQPSDTVRAMLSHKGILLRKHLVRGIEKGAITQEIADQRFAAWLEEKAQKIEKKIAGLKAKTDEQTRKSLEVEAAVAHKRAESIMAKNTPMEEASPAEGAAEQEETPQAEESSEQEESFVETQATAEERTESTPSENQTPDPPASESQAPQDTTEENQ